MTAAEAMSDPVAIQGIVEQSGADRRTVKSVLAGASPFGKAWRAVERAAAGLGVTNIPPPRARKPAACGAGALPAAPCPNCVRLLPRIADLTAKLHAAGNALMGKDAELAETERQLANAQQYLAKQVSAAVPTPVVEVAAPQATVLPMRPRVQELAVRHGRVRAVLVGIDGIETPMSLAQPDV